MAMNGGLTAPALGADRLAPAARRSSSPGRLRRLAIVGVSALALSLGACAEQPKTTVGAAGGAAAGGLLGAALGGGAAGIAAGVLLGGLAGGAVGNALDQADREHAYQAQQNSLETAKSGQTVNWTNPDSGHSGTYTPQRTYQNSQGQYCREFQQTVTVGGSTENAYGTACRQPDGTWKIAS
jgi:surface antigen